MPRTESASLTEIFKSYARRDWLDLSLSDDTALHLSRGAVVRNSIVYDNWIASVEDLNASIDAAVDRITINCQNVNSLLGFNVASNLRLLDYAFAEYGKIYQSIRNPALLEDISSFRAVLANAEVSETRIGFELIVDYESLGSVLASRALSPRCWWKYKNGIECTSESDLPTCPKTRAACVVRGKPWEFGGWEFFEEAASDLPGAGGNDGGGIGGGGCFALDTPIWTPRGDVPFGQFPIGVPSERIAVVSFDPLTGEIDYDDEIEEIFEYEMTGYFTFRFEHGEINVTPLHPFFTQLKTFVRANDLTRLDTVRAVRNDEWFDSALLGIKWNSDKTITVRNCRVKKNHTYFASRTGVSNTKEDPQF